MRLRFEKLSGFGRNAKSSVNFGIKLSLFIILTTYRLPPPNQEKPPEKTRKIPVFQSKRVKINPDVFNFVNIDKLCRDRVLFSIVLCQTRPNRVYVD